MSRLFIESFDKLTPAQLQSTLKWALVGNGVVSTTGRTGLGVTGTTGATQADNTLRTIVFYPGFASSGKGYQGFALKVTTLPAAERKLWAVLDNVGDVLITLTIRTDGKVRVYRGTFEGGTLVATSSTAFVVAAAFRYLQVGFDFATNSVIVLSTISGTPPITSQLFAVPGLSSYLPWAQAEFYLDETIIIDDYYINDGSGLAGHIFFDGDTTIEALSPEFLSYLLGYENWAPNTGTLVSAVDDDPMDVDATFIKTHIGFSTVRYQFEALVDDGRRVDAVQFTAIARKQSSASPFALKLAYIRWDGIGLFVNNFGAISVTNTFYTAFLGMIQSGGNNEWTIQRVNDSRWGVVSGDG